MVTLANAYHQAEEALKRIKKHNKLNIKILSAEDRVAWNGREFTYIGTKFGLATIYKEELLFLFSVFVPAGSQSIESIFKEKLAKMMLQEIT